MGLGPGVVPREVTGLYHLPLRVYIGDTFFFLKIILTAQIFSLEQPGLHSSGTLADLLSSQLYVWSAEFG